MFKALAIVLICLLTSLSGCILYEDGGLSIECKDIENVRKSDGTLRILTYDIAAFTEEMLSHFTTITGTPVEIIQADDAGGILELMLKTQSVPQADLAIGLDNTYLQMAIDFCLLQEHQVDTSALDEQVLEFYDGKLAVPFDQGDVCINYDENKVNGEDMLAPTTLWDLTQPEWKGRIAFPSPLTSSPGRAFLIATIDYFQHDEDDQTNAFDWWKAIYANEAIFTTGWTEAYEIHYSGGYGEWVEGHIGDAWLTVSYCHSPGVEAYYSENSTHSTSLTLPRSTFHQIEYGSILNGAIEKDAANEFLSYLISKEVNEQMPKLNLMKSVLNNSTWPTEQGYAYHTDEPMLNANISASDIGENIEMWLLAWSLATS